MEESEEIEIEKALTEEVQEESMVVEEAGHLLEETPEVISEVSSVEEEISQGSSDEVAEVPHEESPEESSEEKDVLFSHELSEEKGKVQLSLASEVEEVIPQVVEIKDPKIRVRAFTDMEAGRTAEMKLPLTYGSEEKLPKRNLLTQDVIGAEVLGQELLNLKLVREDGPGRRMISLKGREFRIGFEGTVNPNGSIGMTRLTSYFIHKDLTFKRGIEVYTFIQKLLAGNPLTINTRENSIVVELPQRFEYLKLLKVVEVLYKYYHVAKSLDLSMTEKVGYILKSSKKINEVSMLLNERSVDTMVNIQGGSELERYTGKTLRIIKEEKAKFKNSEILLEKIVEVPEFVLESDEGAGGMSTSWKNAKISYKKVLD